VRAREVGKHRRLCPLSLEVRGGEAVVLVGPNGSGKLNVVLAALGEPEVLLLDEPYQGLDRDSMRRRALVGGRVLALLAVGLALTLTYLLLILADDRPVAHEPSIALLLGATAVIAIALGSALGALVTRELEGALTLFIIAGLQFIADPSSTLAHVLPFWSTREFGTYAVDGEASLTGGLAHAAVAVALAAAVISVRGARSR
jgi:predicted ABC-type transport system involved in lysophospholipase L1 biosynthesis ATPase subunit